MLGNSFRDINFQVDFLKSKTINSLDIFQWLLFLYFCCPWPQLRARIVLWRKSPLWIFFACETSDKMRTVYFNVWFSCTFAKICLRDRENDFPLVMRYLKFIIKRLRKENSYCFLCWHASWLSWPMHELLLWGLVAEMQRKSYTVHMKNCLATTCKRK